MTHPLSSRRRIRLVLIALALTAARAPAAPSPEGEKFRVGFSFQLFVRVNENDARASLAAFAAVLAQERGVPAFREHGFYNGIDSTAAELRRRSVDAVGVSTPELWVLQQEFSFSDFFFDVVGDSQITERYLMLVRTDAGIQTLSELRGRRYSALANPRMSLATVWLDLLLDANQLPPTRQLLGPAVIATKPSKAVLPLFFGQVDACLITERMFATMVELNPQIGAKIAVLATSPGVIPSVLAYHAGSDAGLRQRVLPELSRLHLTPAGRQILKILHCHQITAGSATELAPTLQMLAEHARRCPGANADLLASLRLQRKPSEHAD